MKKTATLLHPGDKVMLNDEGIATAMPFAKGRAAVEYLTGILEVESVENMECDDVDNFQSVCLVECEAEFDNLEMEKVSVVEIEPSAKAGKAPRPKIPKMEVVKWITDNHPVLEMTVEVERDWVWIAQDMSHPKWEPIRASIKEYGFKFAKSGHRLASGRVGWWSHSCEHPVSFKKKSESAGTKVSDATTDDKELVDFLNA